MGGACGAEPLRRGRLWGLEAARRAAGSSQWPALVQTQVGWGWSPGRGAERGSAPTEEDVAAFSADFDFFGIEAIAKGYSKSRGLQIVEEYYGASREDTVAIGDTDPDIDMITYAGIGISMGNGTPNLKACAEYVTKHFREFGVAYAIDKLLEGDLEALRK